MGGSEHFGAVVSSVTTGACGVHRHKGGDRETKPVALDGAKLQFVRGKRELELITAVSQQVHLLGCLGGGESEATGQGAETARSG